MAVPILTTKLYIPASRPNLIVRPRLIELLNTGLDRKLTLISAPAGFGKTTLVGEWVAHCDRPVAWLTLDESDSDPARFLAYLVASLRTNVENVGDGVLRALQSVQLPSVESAMTVLVNEIATRCGDCVLVLDDYHAVDGIAANDVLTFLVEHQPPQMHLVIATREDPHVPLARLRARNEMIEIRAADLCFTLDEATEFLNQVMGLDLQSEDVATLETRTEGWIAGLQLAALSMQGHKNIPQFVQAFAGDHRYIVDYLVSEVLQRQPESVKNFLLQTSILDRLSSDLCNAVTEQQQSAALLEYLERSNLFVVSLDDTRLWFRYHGLFADVLRTRLRAENQNQVPRVHRRASEWYAANDLSAEAVRHGFAAQDYAWTAALIERAWPSMDRSFQTAVWLTWARALPDDVVCRMPVLSVGYAWALLEHGQLEAADVYLRNAERGLHILTGAGANTEDTEAVMVVEDDEQFRSLPASIAAARAYHAQALGDVPATIRYGRQALDLLPEQDYLQRSVAAALLGVAYWTDGDLDAAHSTLAEGMANMRAAGDILFGIRGTYILADIRMAQGRLREAIITYEQSLQVAAEQGEDMLRGTADLYLRLSELYREQDNQHAAAQHLLQSEALGEQAASPQWRYRRLLAQARIKEIEQDFDGALELLNVAEQHYVRTPVRDVRPIGALKARVWAAQGKLPEALAWTRDRCLTVRDELSYLREFEHVTLARVLILQYRINGTERTVYDAIGLLERLLDAAEAAYRMGSTIKILLLRALAYEAQEDVARALVPFDRALALAEPDGYVRMFVDEGNPVVRLLSETAARGTMSRYVSKLLAVFEAGKRIDKKIVLAPTNQPLADPLSQRELEVLHMIAQGCSNRDIANRLFLAVSTVKGHNRAIFAKLQVQRRTEAIARAREMGLL